MSLFDRLENTMGKGENTGSQHSLLFLVFSKWVTLYHTIMTFNHPKNKDF